MPKSSKKLKRGLATSNRSPKRSCKRIPFKPQPNEGGIFFFGWKTGKGFGAFLGKLEKGKGWPKHGTTSDAIADSGRFSKCPKQPVTPSDLREEKVQWKEIKGIWYWLIRE